jgi:hypothetical protein
MCYIYLRIEQGGKSRRVLRRRPSSNMNKHRHVTHIYMLLERSPSLAALAASNPILFQKLIFMNMIQKVSSKDLIFILNSQNLTPAYILKLNINK